MKMRLSRHARNKARRLRLPVDEVVAALENSHAIGLDGDGNAIVETVVRGTLIRAVIALDEPDFTITLYSRRS